jgi:3alpha(or 20beta)-hydroxysteroid dehydrogenase
MAGRVTAPLAGLTVLITGAASGIGKATARLLTQDGVRLILADVDEERLGRIIHELTGSGAPVTGIVTNVSRADAVARLLERAIAGGGAVDVVVHCAGVVDPGPLESTSVESAARQVEVNLLGTIYIARVFLPHFRSRGHGHLIMMASMGAIVPMPNETIYCATKFGVRGFGLALGLELRDSPIQITVMCPDSVRTPQLRREALENGSPLAFASRLLTADEVARAIRGAILQPRQEILVPAFRGVLIRLLNLFPSGLSAALPLLDRLGRRRRAQYVAQLGREPGAAV